MNASRIELSSRAKSLRTLPLAASNVFAGTQVLLHMLALKDHVEHFQELFYGFVGSRLPFIKMRCENGNALQLSLFCCSNCFIHRCWSDENTSFSFTLRALVAIQPSFASVPQKKMTKIFRFEYSVDVAFMLNQYRRKEKYIRLAVVSFDSNNLNSNKPKSTLLQKEKFKTGPNRSSIHLTALELDDANAKIHLLEHETTQFVRRCWYGVVPLCRKMWGGEDAEIGAHNSNHNEPNATTRRKTCGACLLISSYLRL